jgi:hypothetical protein
MAPSLLNRVGLRYEVACDVIGAVISHHAEVLGNERDRLVPDPVVIAASRMAQQGLAAERDALNSDDSAAIEAAIAKYGPIARTLFASR